MTDLYNAWTRAWKLIGKHAAVDIRAKNIVVCKLCGQEHDSYNGDGSEAVNQGEDLCAWSMQLKDGRWVIHCGYGSDFDLTEFWYIKDFPTVPVDGICDWCIRRMVRDGVIIDSGKTCTIEYDGYMGAE